MGETEDLQEAVFELQQYLSDRQPPLMVADSMALLLRYPARIVALEIHAWMAAQHRGHGAAAPVSDYLFHAVKKISLLGDLDLLSKPALVSYIQGLGRAVLEFCPEEDRELLRVNIERLGEAASVTPSSVEIIHRQAGSEQPLATRAGLEGAGPADRVLTGEMAQSFHRLSLILAHLTRWTTGPLKGTALEQKDELTSQFVTAAAVHSVSGKELEEHLGRLTKLGIDTRPEEVLRSLGRSLPGWSLPGGDTLPPAMGSQIEAMRQMVRLADDPSEGSRRFRELVYAAIEQFNEGFLGRAVTIFDLAEELAREQKVRPDTVETLRKSVHERLSVDRLRKLVDSPEKHLLLRKVLDFAYAYRPQGLLDEMRGELKRDRRHLMVSLLQVHGAPARQAASERLQYSVEEKLEGESEWYFQRNLVYLLRAIPRSEDVSVDEEVAIVMGVSGRSSPAFLVKEVIAYLAHTPHEKAERALITYLRVFESMLFKPETAVYLAEEVETLLDRTCSALARFGTVRAWQVLADHGLKGQAVLGTPMARLADAGTQDLSIARDVVDRLLAALKAELPRTVLGMVVKKNDENIVYLIQALSGTPLPEVVSALQEIVQAYQGSRIAEAATKALNSLATVGKAKEASATLSGDLDLFDLPALLTSLSDMQLTGVLTLLDTSGRVMGTVVYEEGRFRGSQVGLLAGPEALYQLFERPFPGTFAFVSRKDHVSRDAAGTPLETGQVIMDGMRRYDELKLASAVVPDQVSLTTTDTPPTPLASEKDEAFARAVWEKAADGVTPLECESAVRADAHRIRRLLAHWVEEGSLRPR